MLIADINNLKTIALFELIGNRDGSISLKNLEKDLIVSLNSDNELILIKNQTIASFLMSSNSLDGAYSLKCLSNSKYLKTNSKFRLVANGSIYDNQDLFYIEEYKDNSGFKYKKSLDSESDEEDLISLKNKVVKIQLKTNNKYFKLEGNSLLANKENSDNADKFKLIQNDDDGSYNFQLVDKNEYYLTIDVNNQIKLSNESFGNWRRFEIANNSDGSYSFKSIANKRYSSVDYLGNSEIIANSKTIGDWESFLLQIIPMDEYEEIDKKGFQKPSFTEFINALTYNKYPVPTMDQYNNFITGAQAQGSIKSKRELAMFLAQIIHESGGLQHVVEEKCGSGCANCQDEYTDPKDFQGIYYFMISYVFFNLKFIYFLKKNFLIIAKNLTRGLK